MRFKNKKTEKQYKSRQLHPVLLNVCLMVDILAKYAGGPDEGIRITSLYRPDDNDSYHSIWRAVDMSTEEWTQDFRDLVARILTETRQHSPNIQRAFEDKSRGDDGKWYDVPHLHIEFSDGSLEKN